MASATNDEKLVINSFQVCHNKGQWLNFPTSNVGLSKQHLMNPINIQAILDPSPSCIVTTGWISVL